MDDPHHQEEAAQVDKILLLSVSHCSEKWKHTYIPSGSLAAQLINASAAPTSMYVIETSAVKRTKPGVDE